MKKVIITTTINSPTEAVLKFGKMTDWEMVVVGDRKTPTYPLERGLYLAPEIQEKYDKRLSDAIGWNCIQRRNFGLLWAKDMKADIVALVDDDNIPYEGWGQNLMIGKETEVNFYETDLPAFDPVGATNHRHIWHRGFPLQLLPKRDYSQKSHRKIVPDVQADAPAQPDACATGPGHSTRAGAHGADPRAPRRGQLRRTKYLHQWSPPKGLFSFSPRWPDG